MKKFTFVLVTFFALNVYCQTPTTAPILQQPGKKITPTVVKGNAQPRIAKKPGVVTNTKTPATLPVTKAPLRNIVYQYVDTAYPSSENHFPINGNAGIGTNTPQAALEIKRSAGDTRKKNVLLQLSNIWSPNGQNEPSIMFSNGDNSAPANVSYWTLGARVSGDKTLNTPQTFKISYKAPGSGVEQEYFSVDSYQGRVKIGDVSTNFDGYKLYVEQGILTEKVKVAVKNSEDWFDNVLSPDYKLMPLLDLGKYMYANHHLPEVPTTEDVMKNGVDLGKMNALLLKKVEELTRYMVDMKKELDETKNKLEATQKLINKKN